MNLWRLNHEKAFNNVSLYNYRFSRWLSGFGKNIEGGIVDHHKIKAWDKTNRLMWELIDGIWHTKAIEPMTAPFTDLITLGWLQRNCTGLKDKNGKLIFEEDKFTAILFNGDPEGRREYICQFMNGAFYGFPNFKTDSMHEYELLDSLCDLEIIGTTHKNK